MNEARKFLVALAAAGALLLDGCGTVQTYEGQKKAAGEIAVLKTNVGEIALDVVWVGKLDGKEIVLAYSTLELAPGRHALQVNMKRGLITRFDFMMLEAKAGHSYRLRGEFAKALAWIEDESSGEVVAGVKP